MKCPHCYTAFHEGWNWALQVQEPDSLDWFQLRWLTCPECRQFVVHQVKAASDNPGVATSVTLLWPLHGTRPVPPEVEKRFADDYRQACATLSVSPKASAALSRRLLQDIVQEKAGIKKRDLDTEIQAVIDAGNVPSWLAENLDSVRVVGNFAAHPIKSTHSGTVVDVEPGEAEFLLDVLEGALDFYFVQPERARRQRAAINTKLEDADKPPLKT